MTLIIEHWQRPQPQSEDGATVTLQRLRRELERKVDAMALPRPLTIERLRESLQARRSRPLQVLPMPLPAGGPCGLWVSTAAADYIVVESDTSAAHQQHILLHEIAHVLLEHASTQVLTDDATALLMPHLDATTVEKLMARTWFDEAAEREAEVTADILSKRMASPVPRSEELVPPEVSDIIDRLRRSLERPR
ncbi:ImmA/IrrE family metallo-endopeptidase [Dactylosporangium sp. NPDC048998]|uniref:ImmA/IrrE family metallo-endopeptidase n=1 Tax=Dactylosporangium sp. NPDC048998 TaxID=3363976 RepID=UPI00371E0ADC